MTNQGVSIDAIGSADSNSLQVGDTSQGHASSFLPSTTGVEAASWPVHRVENSYTDNGTHTNPHDQHAGPHLSNAQDGSNIVSFAGASSSFSTAGHQEYNGYAQYQGSSEPYNYSNMGYSGYYNSYLQQSNNSYSQPVGAYQNLGAPYQPLSSFQNAGSYPEPASYSSTYYNPGDYQTFGGYQSSGYSNNTNMWSGNYANYNLRQYPTYTPDSSGAYNSNSGTATSLHYQQDYKRWADYYSQTEVSCAPGTENVTVTGASNLASSVPSAAGAYVPSSAQPSQPYSHFLKPEMILSQYPPVQAGSVTNVAPDGCKNQGVLDYPNNYASLSQPHVQKLLDSKPTYDIVQDQQMTTCSQGPNSQHPSAQHVAQVCHSPLDNASSLDARKVSKMQIPTNPRIASNLPMGLPKVDKDSCTTNVAVKPAYISVSLPKPNDKLLSHDAAESILKPGVFPPSLRGYVERALARCKDERQMIATQAVMKEMITKATTDGTLHTKDWDTEALFPLPNLDVINRGTMQCSSPASSLTKYQRSPTRRVKSRWEPMAEEKLANKNKDINHDCTNYNSWFQLNEVNRKFSGGNSYSKDAALSKKFNSLEQRTAKKNSQRTGKRQRIGDGQNVAADASSDSDIEQGLAAYSSDAMALANSPEERKRRENRYKRFEKGHGHQKHFNSYLRPKNAGAGNLYARRANALVLNKDLEDGSSRAVEDIDWDSLTLKGTCQEIEKRYLRLTSAPDPTTVRPIEVLEKALHMVQTSEKNYLYKCDQIKSIRQDLTVQRIRDEFTVKVYETHARLALEVGDLPEYNQCQSQLKVLYAEGIAGCYMEFSAYNLLCVIMHSNNNRDLLSSMSRLSITAKKDEAVKHALAVRAALTSGNYVKFFRLYKAAPNLNACLMDLYVEKMRYAAVRCMCRSYRPTVPVTYIAQALGFTSILPSVKGVEDTDGMEECVEWLRAHGACLIGEQIGDMQLDAKASSSGLYMPEPEDAVAHGDSTLAVDDFLTRTS